MLKSAYILFSFRHELFYVLLTFLFVLMLPIIGFIVITNTGIQAVSDILIDVNPQTKEITLFTPTGEVFKKLNISVTWPVAGVISQEFGDTELPYYLYHTGIDIAGRKGDPVTVAFKGKVIHTGTLSWGFGKHIIVDHGDNITTVYAHLDTILVEKDDEVEPGKVIGTEGSTGWSTGPHLHFEVRVFGIPVNPRVFLGENTL